MGILNWLRVTGSTTPQSSAGADIEGDFAGDEAFPNILHLSSRNFFGLCSRSPSKRYTLAWSDADESGSRGGARTSGLGRYILLEGRNILVEGRMERPNDGKVADNGVFVFNDWQFSSDLSGIFWAFRPDGKKIISRRFKANLFNNGLSADGCLAVCQTCNSPDPDDCSVLTVFDLTSGTEIASWPPESGWANFYEFPPGHQTIRLGYADGSAYAYRLDGEFVDRVKWADAELSKGNLFVVERFMKAAGSGVSPELARRLLASIDVAIRNSRPGENRTPALGFKLRGLCLETQNAMAEALESYEKALALDSKIGVKRRADQLRKILA
jgi:hypothetical protein